MPCISNKFNTIYKFCQQIINKLISLQFLGAANPMVFGKKMFVRDSFFFLLTTNTSPKEMISIKTHNTDNLNWYVTFIC